MADNRDTARDDSESQLLDAIQAFEQILEAMPDDRSSLETLAHAYAHIGDHARAKDYLIRLGHVILADADEEAARELCEQLAPFDGDPELDALLPQLRQLTGLADTTSESVDDSPESVEQADETISFDLSRFAFRVTDELALAWALFEAEQLTQTDYASVAQDLTEMSSEQTDATISVLHVLEHRGHKNLDKIVAHIANHCSAPVIALSCFDPPREALELLPIEFVIHRGAVVFDFIKDEALVAVVNPHDQRVRQDVAALTGRKCHFFTSGASDFDAMVSKILEVEKTE